MKRNRLLFFQICLLFLTMNVAADVVPRSKNGNEDALVDVDLVITTNEDLSDYRFFLDYNDELREIKVKNKGETIVPPDDATERFSKGALYAVPAANLKNYESVLTAGSLKDLLDAIKNKKIDGAVKMFDHEFIVRLPKDTRPPPFKYSIYRVENRLSYVKEKINTDVGSAQNPENTGIRNGIYPYILPVSLVAAGILLAVGFFGLGLWLLQRKKN